MTTQIILFAVIALLVVYIIILRLKLIRKNIGNEFQKQHSIPENINKPGHSLSPEKLLEKNSTDFIFENSAKMSIYMHYTREEADAKRIVSEGFKFADSFHNTALHVVKDNLDLRIKHMNRKLFGDYLIIICIASEIVNRYTEELEKAGIKNCSYENLLTETEPVRNENSDLIYKLNNQYIKGYINHKNGEIIKNERFDPFYDSPVFIKNIDFFRSITV